MRREHQSAGHHIPQRTVCLPPVPLLTQSLGQLAPARTGGGVHRDQLANLSDIGRRNRSASVAQQGVHAANDSRTELGT